MTEVSTVLLMVIKSLLSIFWGVAIKSSQCEYVHASFGVDFTPYYIYIYISLGYEPSNNQQFFERSHCFW